jgi:hypothetical protein
VLVLILQDRWIPSVVSGYFIGEILFCHARRRHVNRCAEFAVFAVYIYKQRFAILKHFFVLFIILQLIACSSYDIDFFITVRVDNPLKTRNVAVRDSTRVG